MKTFISAFLITLSLNLFATSDVGKPAPDFSAPGADGKTWSLAAQKGKVVVLEWFNNECPFVKKHYDTGNMQSLQKTYTDKGVVWFTVFSSAKGKQGYAESKEATQILADRKAHSTVAILDPHGTVGKLFEAKTTPHVFVVNKEGILVYSGAVDDQSSTDPRSLASANKYLANAVDATLSNQPVKESSTKAYGCSVKYE